MPSLESNRRAKAARFARHLRASWAKHPVQGQTLLQVAALLTVDGWRDVAEQAGENFPSPETQLEVLRHLAVGEWVASRVEPDPFAGLSPDGEPDRIREDRELAERVRGRRRAS